jgi:peptidyl-tRNA hydrolase
MHWKCSRRLAEKLVDKEQSYQELKFGIGNHLNPKPVLAYILSLLKNNGYTSKKT